MTKQYAKLISETQVEFPPKNKGPIINYNLNEELLKADGYKLFIPAEKEIGKSYTITYNETATKIIEVATEIPQPTPEERLAQAKKRKYQEALEKANDYLDNEAMFELEENVHIEATKENMNTMATAAIAIEKGLISVQPWTSKEDTLIELNEEECLSVSIGIGEIQSRIWNNQFLSYKTQIDSAKTIEEVEAILILYSNEVEG
jgi:hypothetical protein